MDFFNFYHAMLF